MAERPQRVRREVMVRATGLGEVPGITGRPPIYVVRQLNDMQNGNRTGSLAELMKAVVAKLSIEDMVAIAAYLGSLEP